MADQDVKFNLVEESDHLELKVQRIGGHGNVLCLGNAKEVSEVVRVCESWLAKTPGRLTTLAEVMARGHCALPLEERERPPQNCATRTTVEARKDYLDRLKSALYSITDIADTADAQLLSRLVTNEIRSVKILRTA